MINTDPITNFPDSKEMQNEETEIMYHNQNLNKKEQLEHDYQCAYDECLLRYTEMFELLGAGKLLRNMPSVLFDDFILKIMKEKRKKGKNHVLF